MAGECLADFVLEGTYTYERALYILFYRWKYEDAINNFNSMNTCIWASNRGEVIPNTDRCREIVELALAYRIRYFDTLRREAKTIEARKKAYDLEMDAYQHRRTLML